MTNNAPDTTALLLTPAQACKSLAISPRLLWSLTHERHPALPHIRVGRLVRYSNADLNAWVASQRQASVDP